MAVEWTVARLLESMRGFLQTKGIDTPRLDAEVLLSHILQKPRIYLYTHYDQPITDDERSAVRELCKRRAQHEPVAYLVGSKEFYGLSLTVNRDVLIPRPETEQLVDLAIEFIRRTPDKEKRFRVLDIGTGSGAIAIALAMQEPRVDVVAIDLSVKALAVAKMNVEQHQLQSRVELVHAQADSLLSDQVPLAVYNNEPFDLIVSNPPYIGLDEKPSLATSVVAFEPHEALFSGAEGSVVIEQVMQVAQRFLAADGMLAMEIAPRHAESLLTKKIAHRAVRVLDDLAGHARVLVMHSL